MEKIEDTIKDFLKDDEKFGEVLKISADWGVGKTYIYKQIANEVFRRDAWLNLFWLVFPILGIVFCWYWDEILKILRPEIIEIIFKVLITLVMLLLAFKIIAANSLKASNWYKKVKLYRILNNKKRHIYISLFGLNSIEEIKRIICFGKANSFVKDITTYLSSGDAVATAIAFRNIKNTTICFDDFERKGDGLKIEDLMGFVSDLKEQHECKIVLILNVNKFKTEEDKKEFLVHSEKVIDKKIMYNPESKDNVPKILGDEKYKIIIDACNELEINNLRTVNRVKYLADELHKDMVDCSEEEQSFILRSLVFLVWMYDNRDDNNVPKIERFKLLTHKHIIQKLKEEEKEDEDEKEKRKEVETNRNRYILEYGFKWVDGISNHLCDLVDNGLIIEKEIIKSVQETKIYIKTQGIESEYGKAWGLFHNSFSNNEDQVLEKIFIASKNISEKISLNNMDGAIHLLRECGWSEKADELIKLYSH